MENDKETDISVEPTETVETETPSQPKPVKKARAPRKPSVPKAKKALKLEKEVAPVSTEPQPQFLIGTSMTRPMFPVVNTIVYETDTGHRVQFNGTSWDFIDKLD